jgi:hypothetical protein
MTELWTVGEKEWSEKVLDKILGQYHECWLCHQQITKSDVCIGIEKGTMAHTACYFPWLEKQYQGLILNERVWQNAKS